ncbi:MAG: hypothetical protein IID28_15450, partial [Planctomycetes bacterium]|nr:hypothetical protein [Planctomycetota bacterium]
MRNTTTTVVIAAGAVLAAVIVTRTPAQVSLAGSGTACCLPDGGCQVVTPADCLSMGGIPNASGQPNCSFIVCAPIPTVVALALHDRGFPRISRAWSDGQVDVTVIDDNVWDATIL